MGLFRTAVKELVVLQKTMSPLVIQKKTQCSMTQMEGCTVDVEHP